jgi:hypothetical protein
LPIFLLSKEWRKTALLSLRVGVVAMAFFCDRPHHAFYPLLHYRTVSTIHGCNHRIRPALEHPRVEARHDGRERLLQLKGSQRVSGPEVFRVK